MRIGSRTAGTVFALVVAAGLGGPAAGDTTLHYQVSRGGDTAPMVVKAQPGAVRVEGAAIGGRFKWMVYRSADNTLYAVDPERKIVLALDSAGIDRIEQRMQALRTDLRERLKRMPVGQRKFVKSQIGDFLEQPQTKAGAARVEMTDAETRIGDVVCRTGRIVARGRPVGDLCVASARTLDMTSAALDAYQGLYRLINGLQAAMASGAADTPDIAALNGVPVRMRIETSGVAQTLQQVTHRPLHDDLFDIPEGYRRKQPRDLMQ